MTSITNASANTSRSREREVSSSSPTEHRTTSSTFSAPNRYSYASSETGESSTAVSKRNSMMNDGTADGATNGGLTAEIASRDGRGSYRSHRSRNSGGFLLSNTTFEPPLENTTDSPSRQTPTSDHKGKSALRSPEKKHKKRRSNLGLGVGSSPLAGNVTNAPPEPTRGGTEGQGGDTTEDGVDGADDSTRAKAATGGLDVDSAQIVNLALNLSESRRNASRRIISSPLPPPVTGFAENMAGGSMRYHMQQQRRTSRNVSPKPDRGEKAMTTTSRVASGQRINSPLQPAFDMQPDGAYQYHFSASTLARAEKAKNAIELMAQYRQLLQYVPPLKPQVLERTTTASPAGTAPGSPTSSTLSPFRTYSRNTQRPLGRHYNPLQYIRNRKVRARNSKAIDGEAQGFADLDKVSIWVGEVARESSSEDFLAADCLSLPSFFNTGDPSTAQHTSPQSTLGKSSTTAKIKRPRIDWMMNPADMLADVFWLEQDDNKKLIEDRHGRRIFPREVELKRPVSRRGEEQESRGPPSPTFKIEEHDRDLRVDTKLPEFKSIKPESEKFPEMAASKARQKLREVRDAARMHHGHNGSTREARQFLRARSKSDSDSSDSDTDHRPRRRRSDTADSHDRGKDILEKQMAEMIAKESKDPDWNTSQGGETQQIVTSIEAQKPHLKEDLENSRKGSASHSRSASLVNRSKRDSFRNGSSGRASLEVPGGNPRGSLEDLDTTAPNSPEWKARRASNSHIPSIAMDLSSPRGRHSSPSRRALSRVRSKIRPNHERSHHSDGNHAADEETVAITQSISKEQTPDGPETPERRRRSISPSKKIIHRKTDDSIKTLKKTGSLRRAKGEDSSGIRGFLKSARNPVARVSDLLWKKESSPGHGTSSGVSTDESDIEDTRGLHHKGERESSRESSVARKFDDLDKAWPRKEKPSYLSDMPTFTSPFEHRGRPTESRSDEPTEPSQSLIDLQEAREKRRKSSRAHLLDPTPRIDVHSPTSSPEMGPSDGVRRGSSISDLESRRGSFSNGVQSADSRLNAVLGFPGKRRNGGLPITGLANLEITNDRRPSMEGKRQWSISDRGVSVHRGPMTKREIARVRALLLSSGIKAKEISRRAAEPKDLTREEQSPYAGIAALADEEVLSVPRGQEHILAARILSNDIQLSSRMWQQSADTFCNTTISDLLSSVESLQSRLVDNLTPMTRKAADEADEVSKDLVTSQTLKVKRISDKIDKMIRTRRRRFRWLRRGGWVLVEWALVGVMWYVWFMVVLARVIMGVGRGVVGSLRWLFFV